MCESLWTRGSALLYGSRIGLGRRAKKGPIMYLMIEKGIRGGISTIMKRYSASNHKYLSNHNPNEESKYIEYLEANNLYGRAMSNKLLKGSLTWMTEKELTNWKNTPCILEVGLEYRKELHDLHNQYPLAPERLTIGKVDKLVPNLNDKEKHVLHQDNLKLYTKLGLRLTKYIEE